MSPVKKFQKVPKWTETHDPFNVARLYQAVDHVKHEQGLHPIVGKTFPRFGECDVAEAARMSEEGAILGVMHGRRVLPPLRFGKLFGSGAVQPCWPWRSRASSLPSGF